MKQVIRRILFSVATIGVIILITYLFLVRHDVNPIISSLIAFMLGLLVSMINLVISNLKSESISRNFEKTMNTIFLIAVILATILTILLAVKWIPNYFNSIYILLGSIMVAAIGFYLNSRLENEKEDRKKKRVVYVVNDTIQLNKKIAEKLLDDLRRYGDKKLDYTLKKGFWDIFSANIIDIDLDPELVKKLVTIKELTYEINELTKNRNDYLTRLYTNLPLGMDLLDRYDVDGKEIVKLERKDEIVIRELEKFVEKSSQYLSEYDI
jgi:hypothetical protein